MKKNSTWIYPFVITDRGTKTLSFKDVRLTKKHVYSNAGWHLSNCFKINYIIRKFESFAHTEYNINKYKNNNIY